MRRSLKICVVAGDQTGSVIIPLLGMMGHNIKRIGSQEWFNAAQVLSLPKPLGVDLLIMEEYVPTGTYSGANLPPNQIVWHDLLVHIWKEFAPETFKVLLITTAATSNPVLKAIGGVPSGADAFFDIDAVTEHTIAGELAAAIDKAMA